MKDKSILFGIIGFLGGALIAVLLASNAVNSNNSQMMRMMGMHMERPEVFEENMMHDDIHRHSDHSSMTMDEMVGALEGKSGTEFDREFLEGMIEHHEGAVDMAELALRYAGRDEIKRLAEEIIEAQEKEIEMMRQWMDEWGY